MPPTGDLEAEPEIPSLLLESVRLVEIQLPLREPFTISSGTSATRRIFLLELTDADGAVCWSECVAGALPNYSPETIDTAWLAISEWLAPRLLGIEVRTLSEAADTLERDVRGHEMARAALEMGLWGLAATKAGVPLAALLGGPRDRVAVGISLGLQQDAQALIERAERALADGYRKIKIKIRPGQDIDYLTAAREALGEAAPLMADANNAYTLADAEDLAALDSLRLIMIEQPLAWDDVVRHAELQQRLKTPICLDESITSLRRAEDMIRLDAGRIINIKPGRVGGLRESCRIHDLCAREGVPVWCGGMLESGIGRAYNVALAALENFTIPGDISPSARYWERDVVTPEWTMSPNGEISIPRGPGLGVEVDRDLVEDLTVRAEVLRTDS